MLYVWSNTHEHSAAKDQLALAMLRTVPMKAMKLPALAMAKKSDFQKRQQQQQQESRQCLMLMVG